MTPDEKFEDTGLMVIILGFFVVTGGIVLLGMVDEELDRRGRLEAFTVCSELSMDPEKCRKLVEGR